MGLLAKAEAILEQEKKQAELAKAISLAKPVVAPKVTVTMAPKPQVRYYKTAPAKTVTLNTPTASIKVPVTTSPVTPVAAPVTTTPTTNTETTTVNKLRKFKLPRIKINTAKLNKFRKLALAGIIVVSLPPIAGMTTSYNRALPLHDQIKPIEFNQTELNNALKNFQKQQGNIVGELERNMLAQMVYGEAGSGADPFEVIHTVLNRKASPLFNGSIADLITAKGQYVGYDANNPVTPEIRRMVDIAVDEWEANGCHAVDDCDHYYFVTGISGVCNKFEISADHQGKWVSGNQKKYSELRHYCPTAERQAKKFYADLAQTRSL